MQYRYRIYHNEESKSPIERAIHPLSKDQKAGEYDSLPDFITIRLNSCGIVVMPLVTELNLDGVTIILKSDKSENEVFSELTRSLKDLNNQIDGLCLIVDKLPAQ